MRKNRAQMRGIYRNLVLIHKCTTDAFPCYRKAVRNLLQQLDQKWHWQAPLARLILHLDNNLATIEKLLVSMLARRDQWLPHIVWNTVIHHALKAKLRMQFGQYN